MTTVTLDSTLTVSDDVVSQELDGETVLLSLDRAEYFGLNATGTVVWNGLVSGLGLRAIVDKLAQDFTIDAARATGDVIALAQELVDAGLATADA
jgi:hypothetical protein